MANKTRKNRANKKKFRGGSKTINDVQNFIRGKINEYKNSGNEKAYIYEDVYEEILSFINTNINTNKNTMLPSKKETITRPITPKQSKIIDYNHITGLPVYYSEVPVHDDLTQKVHRGYWNPGY